MTFQAVPLDIMKMRNMAQRMQAGGQPEVFPYPDDPEAQNLPPEVVDAQPRGDMTAPDWETDPGFQQEVPEERDESLSPETDPAERIAQIEQEIKVTTARAREERELASAAAIKAADAKSEEAQALVRELEGKAAASKAHLAQLLEEHHTISQAEAPKEAAPVDEAKQKMYESGDFPPNFKIPDEDAALFEATQDARTKALMDRMQGGIDQAAQMGQIPEPEAVARPIREGDELTAGTEQAAAPEMPDDIAAVPAAEAPEVGPDMDARLKAMILKSQMSQGDLNKPEDLGGMQDQLGQMIAKSQASQAEIKTPDVAPSALGSVQPPTESALPTAENVRSPVDTDVTDFGPTIAKIIRDFVPPPGQGQPGQPPSPLEGAAQAQNMQPAPQNMQPALQDMQGMPPDMQQALQAQMAGGSPEQLTTQPVQAEQPSPLEQAAQPQGQGGLAPIGMKEALSMSPGAEQGGALPVAAAPAAPVPATPSAIAAQPIKQQPNEMATIMQEYQRKKAELEAKQEKILNDLQGKIGGASGNLLALSRGFLAPNLGGQFATGLGNAIGSYQDYNQQQIRNQSLVAQQQLNLAKLQAANLKDDAAMAMLTGSGGGVGGGGGVGSTQGGGRLGGGGGGLTNITEDRMAAISLFNPKLGTAIRESIQSGRNKYKMSDDGQRVLNIDTMQYEDVTPPRQKQEDIVINGQTYKMRLSDYDAYLKAQDEGWGQEFLDKLGRVPTTGGRPGGRAASEGGDQRPVSVEEMGYEKSRRTVEETKKGEANAATREKYINSASEAPGLISDAAALKEIAKTNPHVFGMLQKPTVVHAILGALEEGIQTPGGSFSVSGLDAAMRKIFGTEEDINAAIVASRFLASMELGAARAMLKGQGAVSDMERRIVKDINGTIRDPAAALIAKANYVMARAEFDVERRELYAEWEDKYPNRSIDRFEMSPEYKHLRTAYDKTLDNLNAQASGSTKKSSSQPAQKPRAANPMSSMYSEIGD
jgi:hypothetical protein